jgi:hypothetical protein
MLCAGAGGGVSEVAYASVDLEFPLSLRQKTDEYQRNRNAERGSRQARDQIGQKGAIAPPSPVVSNQTDPYQGDCEDPEKDSCQRDSGA